MGSCAGKSQVVKFTKQELVPFKMSQLLRLKSSILRKTNDIDRNLIYDQKDSQTPLLCVHKNDLYLRRISLVI